MRRVPAPSRVLWVVALLVVAGGCSPDAAPPDLATESAGGPSVGAGPGGSAAPGLGGPELAWGDGSAVTPIVMSLEAAERAQAGTDFQEMQTVPGIEGGRAFVALALEPSGTVVVGAGPPDNYDSTTGTLRESMVVGEYVDQEFRAFAPTPAVGGDVLARQVYSGSSSGGVTAWAETASTDLYYSNWRVFARSAQGTVRLVARSEEVQEGQLPIVEGDTAPVVSGGRVYLATAAPADLVGTYRKDVVSRAADGTGPLVTEARGASRPAVQDGPLYVVRDSWSDPDVPEGEVQIERVASPGTPEVVLRLTGAGGSAVTGMVASGSRLAFTLFAREGGPSALYVVDPEARRVWVVPTDNAGTSDAVAFCGDLVTWNGADGSGLVSSPQYVYDVGRGELLAIDVAHNYGGSKCAGTMIAWGELDTSKEERARTVVVAWLRR